MEYPNLAAVFGFRPLGYFVFQLPRIWFAKVLQRLQRAHLGLQSQGVHCIGEQAVREKLPV